MLENLIGRHVLIFVLKVQCLITLFTRTKYFFKAFWSKTSWVQRGNERLFSRWMVGKYFWCVIFGGQLVQAIKHLSNVFISFSVKLVFLISRATSSCTLTSFSCTDRILKMSISLPRDTRRSEMNEKIRIYFVYRTLIECQVCTNTSNILLVLEELLF